MEISTWIGIGLAFLGIFTVALLLCIETQQRQDYERSQEEKRKENE